MPQWHHSPLHVFMPGATYMVTAGTLHKEHFFRSDEKLALLQNTLFTEAEKLEWNLSSWAVFSNHYHFIAFAPQHGQPVNVLIRRLHSITAREVNRTDTTPGRQVWFQYWDTCLTFEKSYMARLKYVHYNAVHHKIVTAPELYPFCSASWLLKTADAGYLRKLESFRIDKLNVRDDF